LAANEVTPDSTDQAGERANHDATFAALGAPARFT